MAINRTPVLKRCRQLGLDPAVLGYSSKKESIRQPKRRRKESEYGMQLREKQKAKRAYGVLETQFHRYFESATREKGITGENLLVLLERRLDNVVYRCGFGSSRAQARQLVRHGHIRVNGKKVNIPSFLVNVGDVITIREKTAESDYFKGLREGTGKVMPSWITIDAANLKATIEKHNGYIDNGEDLDFHKVMASTMVKIEEGPYYALPQFPSVHHTMGGLVIDTMTRVLDIYGQPIEGLYAAGEVTGGVHGTNRLGSNADADACGFGYISGIVVATGELPDFIPAE